MTDHAWSGSFSVPSHVLLQELPDQGLIFLDLRTEEYFGLDEVGTRMYETVVSAGTADGAFDQLVREYDVNAETLRSDLSSFLSRLVERGLLAHEPS